MKFMFMSLLDIVFITGSLLCLILMFMFYFQLTFVLLRILLHMLDSVINPIIFPAPNPSYTRRILAGELIYIPDFFTTKVETIPCFYYQVKNPDFVLIHFHANAEDIGTVEQFLKELAHSLNCSVISPEFPGYGIRDGYASEKTLFETAECVYYFITKSLGFSGENIIVSGRSIGTSAAMYLASITSKKESSLIQNNNEPFRKTLLISPFTSINDVVSSMIFSGFGAMLKRTLDNLERVKNLENDLIVIHGEKDEIIPVEQGKKMVSEASNAKSKVLYLRKNMTHNRFNYENDIIEPIKECIKDVEWGKKTLMVPDVYYKDVNLNTGHS